MRTAIYFALLGLALPACYADAIYVDGVNGDDGWSGLCQTWDGDKCGPKRTIQAGIDKAKSGDSVKIAKGTYEGDGNSHLRLERKNVAISGPATILGGQNVGPSFMTGSGVNQSSIVEHLYFEAGQNVGGTFFRCESDGPTFRDCTSSGNYMKWARVSGPVRFERCFFYGEEGLDGGNGVEIVACEVRVGREPFRGGPCVRTGQDCLIEDSLISGFVGVIAGDGMVMRGSVFQGSDDKGVSGIVLGTSATIEDCEIAYSVEGGAAGYVLRVTSDSVIRRTKFLRCGGMYQECVNCSGARILLDRVTFTENSPDVAMLTLSGGPIELTRCEFRNNSTYGSRHLIDCRDADVSISDCLFAQNKLDGSLLVHASESDVLLSGVTAASNGVRGDAPVVEVAQGTLFRMNDSIFFENAAARIKVGEESRLEIRYTDLEGGESRIDSDESSEVTWGPGNLDVDPKLNSTFQLESESACRDAGDPAEFGLDRLDLEGQPRVMNGRVDMGADEFSGRAFVTGDMNCDGIRDFMDIDGFVLALIGPDAYDAAYPDCEILNADVDRDGEVNFNDIDGFVELLLL